MRGPGISQEDDNQRMIKISLIIPSYNQASYIEEALQSVLGQNYPNLELLIMDGGSSDGTINVIKKYESSISEWVSEPDGGQSHALNKGLARMSGEVWAYLNSDDVLCPDCLEIVSNYFTKNKVDWLCGSADRFSDASTLGEIIPEKPVDVCDYLRPWARTQQYLFPCSVACFMRREIYEKIGGFNETYHYSMDMEYYTRALFKGGFRPVNTKQKLGRWRQHEESKTAREGVAYGFRQEELRIAAEYLPCLEKKDQNVLRKEIRSESLFLITRRACYNIKIKKPARGLAFLLFNCVRRPILLRKRFWWGALRELLKFMICNRE